MEAGVVDRVERAADVEERDLLAARLDALPRPGRDVADGGDLDEVRHAAASGTRSRDRSRRERWPPRSPAQRGAQLARQQLDRAARAAGLLLAPLALGLEAAVADQEPPRFDRLPDGVRVERVAAAVADGLQHVGHHAQEGAQRHAGLDAVLAAHPGAREDSRDLLEVVQEEALRRVAEAVRLPPAEGVERGEDALQLLGERRLCDPPVSDTEELDLAVER